ncbi:hypothetical protein HRI96_02855 [Treponema parvum]|uniref:Uncharacterized protein n=1 Tax=Treponema parvum TaxID=138851 RepID=A0A975F544_9SPIR|nr:DUF6672 family protein [Treponema parvum]QTQ11226.1 hypothetical protein HRI96_02855 [Treponema parvum]QTQ14602.1 hypothetical protein HRQ91_09105 [Treponema parvum]QTQ16843.1 hypothetical protein HXT04_09140 [Treponema parvum]
MQASRKKTLIIRAVLITGYVLLGIVMFVTGRSHTVLIDNKNAEDASYKAINGMEVSINRLPPSEFMKGDRDKFIIKGQRLKIRVASFDGQVDEVFNLKIPLTQDAVLVSVPKLVNKISGAVEPFSVY